MTEDALGAMHHGELVSLLNRLYARWGEPALAASTASASSDDELRDRIRGVRRRVLAKEDGRTSRRSPAESAEQARPVSDRPRQTPPRGEAGPARRAFVVLVSDDEALARRARSSCSARGIVLVWAPSAATLAKLVTSVTPTHVVIGGSADQSDEVPVRELAARGAHVRWCRGAKEMLAALAEIE
jgi:hypothetical protein